MNRKREAYDRLAVGDRIRKKRVQLGFSQDEVAERIDRAPKYCSDIERGPVECPQKQCLRFLSVST